MKLKTLPFSFTVCKLSKINNINFISEFCFIGKTDEEISLVCKTEDTPADTIERDDGWRGFRIEGVLDFLLSVFSQNYPPYLQKTKSGYLLFQPIIQIIFLLNRRTSAER